MALSISSFDSVLPAMQSKRVWGLACAMVLVVVGLGEGLLATRGYLATVNDSFDRWSAERDRASEFGVGALIFVGASRIQLGINFSALKARTKLVPVQLAIDGSSFVPVLLGLAKDPSIRGTVVVDLMPGPIDLDGSASGISDSYQQRYDAMKQQAFRWPDYLQFELWLSSLIRPHLLSYADEARPLDAWKNRILNPQATPQYLLTLPDRSRLADYRQVAMPRFYWHRVLRHLGNPPPIKATDSDEELGLQLTRYVQGLTPMSADLLSQDALHGLDAAVSAIQARGGRVVFLAMPTSGLIRAADERRYPRSVFWDRIAASTHATAIHWQDYPALSAFACPDGSHLDRRDTTAFTEAFAEIAGLM